MKIDVNKMRLWNMWQIVSNDTKEVLAEKRYSKMKTKNELRYLAVSYIVNHDYSRHGWHIDYIWYIS